MSESTDRPGPRVSLPHARERVPDWRARWQRTGQMVLLLDFDGTLAPIVERPELAGMPARTGAALRQLLDRPGAVAAVVSGRGMADARERAGIPGIAYAGNHGMEIEGPGIHRIHRQAAEARPRLERVRDQVAEELGDVEGAVVEDKGLTLSIHYRLVNRARVERVREVVRGAAAAQDGLRVTEGKEVLEVRPDVEWDKGRAVEFLLEHLRPADDAPVLYIGDDVTDEDAFGALRRWRGGAGEGVIVADPPPGSTAAGSYVRDPAEVAELLEALALAPA